jgi:hypothetical protein
MSGRLGLWEGIKLSVYKGTPETVGELIEVLQGLPADKRVRVLTLSHEFPPAVREHELCITLEP